MKPLQWFRLYAEVIDDVKLLALAPSDRWFYVALLACKAQALLEGEDPERRFRHVALKLRLDHPELKELSRRLAEADLINEETLQPLNWDKRQFRSDHDERESAERVRAWREKRRNQNVTTVTPPGNQAVTTDRDRDRDRDRKEKKGKNNTSPSAPRDVDPQVWDDWKALRKAKRAAVTATAVAGIRNEAEKAGMTLEAALRLSCERGWAGFKAEWVSKAAGGRSKYEEQAERVIRMMDKEVIDG